MAASTKTAQGPNARSARTEFHRRWVIATLAGAVIVSGCDALLLERSKGFFTGGFLSVDYLQGPGQTALFLLISLLIDAALIGFVTAVVAWALGRTPLHARAGTFAGVLVATGALIGFDIVSYEIIRYFGDSFDLRLMFDLTGGSLAEILAVASSHLVGPILLALAATAVGGGLVFVAHRYSPAAPAARPDVTVLGLPTLVATLGLVTIIAATTSSDTLENGLLRKPAGRLLAFIVNAISDVDNDGYGVVGRISDPDAWNASVSPYAADLPGNGIDENGVGGDLPPDEPIDPGMVASTTEWRRRPDVVLIVLESFRADLVGAYQNDKPVTPVMDALAARGVSLRAAYSHNGYTVQSRHHLFTGSLSKRAADGTLIDDFKANGYLVGYFSGQDESFGGAHYDVGFSRADASSDARRDRTRRYTTSTTPGSLAVASSVVQERVGEFLGLRGSENRPLFLYVNFHDTHFPYWHDDIETLTSPVRLQRERIALGEREALWVTYTNTAANVDRAVGEVLDAVRRVRGKEPGVIITADHGESLFDEGFLGHGYGLNDVQSRIPLIAANLPLELPEPFGQIDLRPAIAAAMSQPVEMPSNPVVRPVEGRALFQYLGDLTRPRQIAFLRDGGRVIFDFRSHRVQMPGHVWLRPADLSPPQHEEFLGLIHQWEWINLARRKRGLVGQ